MAFLTELHRRVGEQTELLGKHRTVWGLATCTAGTYTLAPSHGRLTLWCCRVEEKQMAWMVGYPASQA